MKETKVKFKFKELSCLIMDEEDLLTFTTKVNNPFPYKNLPFGEYLVRGSTKNSNKLYLNTEYGWFIDEKVYSTIDVICDYELFPKLSEKEYSILEKIGYEKLNKYWKNSLLGYLRHKELKKIENNSRRAAILIFKKL